MKISQPHVIDLTIPLDASIVMWPGVSAPDAETLVTVKHDGFFGRRVSFFEHSGTHFDAPCHFIEGGNSVDQVPVEKLFVPVVVIDISQRIGLDADGVLLPEDIHEFERVNGQIPAGSAVLLRTGWEEFNKDREKYAGADGDLRFPGFGVDAAKILVNDRGVVGLGIDTLGIDSGIARDFPVHLTVSHPKGLWHLENLQNLKRVPAVGAWIFVGVLPLVGGSGSPARVIALVNAS
ncbi:MAG: cyclase family protein [Actinomycetes bacterium]